MSWIRAQAQNQDLRVSSQNAIFGCCKPKEDTPVGEFMEEGSENHPKAAREKAAEKVDDPDSQAVEAKVQVRIMQSILTTPLWKRQKGKERWKERFQRKRCIYKQLKGRRQNQNQQSSVAIKEPSSAQQNPKAEEAWSAHEASWSWRSYGNRVDQYSYPDDIWQANEASWQQWTYYAGDRRIRVMTSIFGQSQGLTRATSRPIFDMTVILRCRTCFTTVSPKPSWQWYGLPIFR